MQTQQDGSVVRFGVFAADLRAGELYKSGVRVKLQGQPFQVLAMLLERPGEVVSREELQRRVWPEGTFVDFDHGLSTAIKKIRDALSDDAETPRYIETIPRRGYRFLMPVLGAAPPPLKPEPAEAAPTPVVISSLRKPSGRTIAAIAGVTALMVVAMALLTVRHQAATGYTPHFQQITFRRGPVYNARFAPDSNTVVYAAGWDEARPAIYVSHPENPQSHALRLEGAIIFGVSPKAELAIGQVDRKGTEYIGTTLARVPLDGGAPREIMKNIICAEWTPDGNALAVVRDVNGQQRLEFPAGKVLYRSSGWIQDVRFSPSGDRLAFIDHPVTIDDGGSIAVVDLAGNKQMLSSGWASVQGLAWSPSRSEVWFTGTRAGADRALYAVNLEGQERLVKEIPGMLTLHDISHDGQLLLTRDSMHGKVMLVGPENSKPRDMSLLDFTIPMDISADGKTLLLSESGTGGGRGYAVYLKKTDDSPALRLGEGMPYAFSPDGEWVLAATVAYPRQLMLLPVKAGEARVITNDQISRIAANFLPDGKRIVFAGNEPGHGNRLYVQDLDGGPPRPISPEGLAYTCWHLPISPDGQFVAALASDHKLYLYPINGGEPRLLDVPGGMFTSGSWDSTGRFLYLVSSEMPPKAYRVDIATGKLTLWRDLAPGDPAGVKGVHALLVTPDARTYVYGYLQMLSDLYLVQGVK